MNQKIQRLIVSVLIVAGTAITSMSKAENSISERWTLDRIIHRAAEETADLKALDKDILRAENIARQSGKWDNPEISVSGGPKSISTLNGSVFEASIRQNIPLFGQKSIDAKLESQTRLILESDRKLRSLVVHHEVARLTYRLSAVNEQVKHIGHRREKIRLIAQYLSSRPFASPSQAVEKSLIQNRLREIEEKFLEISASKEKIWQAINIFLNLDHSITPETRWITKPNEINREELWAQVLKQNIELTRQTQLIDSADLAIEKAGKKAYPDIRLGAGYADQNVGIGARERTYAGIIEFSLPIIDRGGYATQAAQAQKEAENYRLDQKRRELSAQFSSSWAELIENKQRIELYPVGLVAELETSMTKAESNWKKGLVPVTAFLELENQVHEQAVKVFDAQTSYVAALSQVLLLAGSDFTVGEK